MKQNNTMENAPFFKIFIFSLSLFVFLHCKHIKKASTSGQVDTLSAKQFFDSTSVCDYALALNFKEIKPKMIPWATDTVDLQSESYIIDGKKLKILQPLKREDLSDSIRRYYFDGQPIKTFRVPIDSLKFNFNAIVIDYGQSPHDIFQKENFILLRNADIRWTGTGNYFSFIQLFDLKKLVCYEFFVNYYACLKYDPYHLN